MGQRQEHSVDLGSAGDRYPVDGERAADYVVETPPGKKSLEGQRSDGNDETRVEHRDDAVEPRCAQRDLRRTRSPVPRAVGPASRKAGRHRGQVNAIAHIVLINEAGTSQPAHQLTTGSSRERPGLVMLDGSGRLTDEHDALTGVAAEHRMRTRDEACIRATGACALRALQGSQRAHPGGWSRHGDPTLTRRAGVAQPKAISSPHRSSISPSQLSGRRGQPSYCEAPCPTSLLAPPGRTVRDETTAPPHGGRRSTEPIFPTMPRCPRRIAAGTRTLTRWCLWWRSPPAAPSRRGSGGSGSSAS